LKLKYNGERGEVKNMRRPGQIIDIIKYAMVQTQNVMTKQEKLYTVKNWSPNGQKIIAVKFSAEKMQL